MDVFVVVFAQLFFFFRAPASKWFLEIALAVFAADHESDLTGRVGGNGGVGVFDGREDFAAIFLEFCDQREMKPLILSCKSKSVYETEGMRETRKDGIVKGAHNLG
jgi:hypothetical protein